MATTYREREVKLDVAADYRLPDLGNVGGTPVEVETATLDLESVYYDTDEHQLLSRNVTLRRREGDADVGWQLKVPSGAARTELQLPATPGTEIPRQLLDCTAGARSARPLRMVATIRTQRRVHRIVHDHKLLAEVADDEVHATAGGTAATALSWREVEIELGPAGDEQLLETVTDRLIDAGARRAAHSSKLERVLGPSRPASPNRATRLLQTYLAEQMTALVTGDIALRRGLDPVHKTRVAARRFRSVLRVYRSVLDRDVADALDQDLSWYQDLLGEVRDREVQRSRLVSAVHALPDELVLGPVASAIEARLLREQLSARTAVTEALDSARYFELLRSSAAFADHPAVGDDVTDDALRRLTRKARRKAAKRLRRGVAEADPLLLHRGRKAAKRARYAIELMASDRGRTGKDRRRIKEYKRLQDALGEHQDSVVAREILRRLGAAATGPDENGFTFGLLYAHEQAASATAQAKATRLLS